MRVSVRDIVQKYQTTLVWIFETLHDRADICDDGSTAHHHLFSVGICTLILEVTGEIYKLLGQLKDGFRFSQNQPTDSSANITT